MIPVAVLIMMTFAAPVCADEPDPIRAQLDRAKAARAETVAKAKATLLNSFDEAIKAVAGLGDLDGVKSLQAEKKAFEDGGKVPDSAKLRVAAGEYRRATRAAQAALEKAYEQAIKDETKALRFDQAEVKCAPEVRPRGYITRGPFGALRWLDEYDAPSVPSSRRRSSSMF
jgi:hypothetical protein